MKFAHVLLNNLYNSGDRMQRRSFLQNTFAGISLFTAVLFQQLGYAQTNETLNITVFPGAQNLALWVAQEKGFFREQGLDINVTLTMNSDDLRNGLINGKFQIAHSAVDNSVAIVVQTGSPSVILMGGDSSMNELFVQPNIKTMQDMRGKKLLVDAPNTAYALQAIRALSLAGVKDTEFSLKIVGRTGLRLEEMLKNPQDSGASTLNPPFSFEAKKAGLHSLGRLVDLVGPYQGQGMFALKPWVNGHEATIEKYITAWVKAVRFGLDPMNKTEVMSILQKNMKQPQDIVEASYQTLTTTGFGLDKDAKFSEAGFKNLLDIRAAFEKAKPLDPTPLVDLRYYQKALSKM